MTREWIHGQCVGCPVPGECGKRCPDLLTDVSGLALGWLPGGRLPATAEDLAPLIDHTILLPEVTRPMVERACEDAVRYGFAAVCVNPAWTELCAAELRGTRVKTCAMVGFPLGASTPETKAFEARDAVKHGAAELDMVLNVGRLRNREDADVRDEIRAVVRAVPGTTVKVILETACLTTDEKVRACRAAVEAGAHFVKTSTGFGPDGANVRDVALLRSTVGLALGVKASGGVRVYAMAMELLRAGASRLGSSSSVKLLSGAREARTRNESR